jgi:hypothetical protein
MRTKPEYLQLDSADDVTSVRDRLTFLSGKPVLLIWPETGSILTRKLDLVLIQREAMRHGIRLALVTHDPQVIRNAAELNISAFETIGSSERKKWKRGRTRIYATRERKPRHEPEPDDLMPYASRVRGEDDETPGKRLRRIIGRTVALGLLGGVVVAAAILLIPGAVVTITPSQQTVAVTAQITADPHLSPTAIDVENGIMPAYTYRTELEERSTINTSGIRELSSTPALGTVVFINRTANAIELPAGTLVSTSAGTPIVFRTTADARVPAGEGGQVEVDIEAIPESTGEVGNVEIGMINAVLGPVAGQVEVRNLVPTFGGSSRTVRVITREDADRLLGLLRQQLQDRALRELVPRIPDSQFIIPETIRIVEERSDWTVYDGAVGDAADTLTLAMRAIVAVSAVDQQVAQQIAYARLSAQVPRGRVLVPHTLRYERGGLIETDPAGRIVFDMMSSAQVRAQIDIGLLQNRLAAQPVSAAADYLLSTFDLAPETTPQITVSPEWMEIMPLLPVRIQVRTVFEEPGDLTVGAANS